MLVDEALRVSVESGATMHDVPIDTMRWGTATVSVEFGPVPEPTPPVKSTVTTTTTQTTASTSATASDATSFTVNEQVESVDVGCLPTPAFQHNWVFISSDTANYGVSELTANYSSDGWTVGSRDLNATSTSLNFTSGSSHMLLHTTDRLPSITATGQGDALINEMFLANRVRKLLVGTPPVAQLNITDEFPGSTISWVSNVTGTLVIDLEQGDTTFELNDSQLENPITVHALANAATSLIVPVVPSSSSTVITLDHQEEHEVEKLVECYKEHSEISAEL